MLLETVLLAKKILQMGKKRFQISRKKPLCSVTGVNPYFSQGMTAFF
jgi:hypothetical protein